MNCKVNNELFQGLSQPALDLASITSHIHNWVLFLFWLQKNEGFFLELFLH